MTDETARPVSLLIAALGGEGGGVLTNWIVRAAEISGLKVQNTSIPGVAQRTGATTYYVEIFPTPLDQLGGRDPILSLYPSVGDIDVMVASELVEAGRAIQNGYVSPDRTTLIGSTHRIFAIGERADMADGRFDGARVMEAAGKRANRALLADYAGLAKDNGTSLNAVLLGVLAATDALPLGREAFAQAIRDQGIAVDANIKGFELGLVAHGAPPADAPDEPRRRRKAAVAELEARALLDFPDPLHEVVIEAVRRLAEFQGARYGARFLDRLAPICKAETDAGGDLTLSRETARHLALWMSYEDIIRVAQLKTSPNRYARVLDEVKAKPGEPVVVTEFLKPGIDEFCSVMPWIVARPILAISRKMNWLDRVHVGMHVKTSSVSGFLQMWALARLRFWRPWTYRFGQEQRRIDAWLDLVQHGIARDPALALEIAECARLIKGYGDTFRRGLENYERVVEAVVEPAIAGTLAGTRASDAIANARAAALADPDGNRLEQVLAAIGAPEQRQAAE